MVSDFTRFGFHSKQTYFDLEVFIVRAFPLHQFVKFFKSFSNVLILWIYLSHLQCSIIQCRQHIVAIYIFQSHWINHSHKSETALDLEWNLVGLHM